MVVPEAAVEGLDGAALRALEPNTIGKRLAGGSKPKLSVAKRKRLQVVCTTMR